MARNINISNKKFDGGSKYVRRNTSGCVVPTQSKSKGFYPKEVFTSRDEYNASVNSVVARIRSGEVQARTPDE